MTQHLRTLERHYCEWPKRDDEHDADRRARRADGGATHSSSSSSSATRAGSTKSATSSSRRPVRRSFAALRARGCDVFLDLKFHDIPNTVAGGVRNAAALGARLVTVHATGGRGDAARRRSDAARTRRAACLAVTVLTSLTRRGCRGGVGAGASARRRRPRSCGWPRSRRRPVRTAWCAAAARRARFASGSAIGLAILVPGVRAARRSDRRIRRAS